MRGCGLWFVLGCGLCLLVKVDLSWPILDRVWVLSLPVLLCLLACWLGGSTLHLHLRGMIHLFIHSFIH